jgi:hypothetical protein
MRRLRRTSAVLIAVLVIGVPALAAAGCGATSHAVGGIVAHKIANHVLGRRTAGKVFCVYHGHRVLVDLHTHHVFAAGINAYEAYKSCKAGFGHHR